MVRNMSKSPAKFFDGHTHQIYVRGPKLCVDARFTVTRTIIRLLILEISNFPSVRS